MFIQIGWVEHKIGNQELVARSLLSSILLHAKHMNVYIQFTRRYEIMTLRK
jgi:hypothetical protein